MKKWIKYMVAAFLAVLLVSIFASCTPETEEKSPKQLAAPTNFQSYEEELNWDRVQYATGYSIILDNGEEKKNSA